MRKREWACSYCGAKPGEQCILTLAPDLPPLSVKWEHRAREEANLVRNRAI